ncbi:MAG: hypothetical protein GZ094_21170 [Mariniphaga sp.]|nr:hypothetical protein [Mariniphaga sp.]
MLAIKADYKDGKITFIDQMPVQIRKAKLTIVVEPVNDPEKLTIPAQQFMVMEKDSESEYKLIGLNSFFDTEDDKNVNWEEYFGLK